MSLRQSKVLIADDSNPVHQLIRDALPNDYSANIVHAFDGVECLQALDHGVDLAFIDVHMPTMGGMDALWAARIAGNKTFVTLISGRSNRRCIDLARQLDAYEFLTKPFGKDEIGAILATHRRVTTPMHVLLVDNSPISLKVMRKVLSSSVFHLDIKDANTGTEALARCKAETFDVVFLDINMPGLNGYATLARIMEVNPQTKVVMISGEFNAPREREALKLGAAAIMHKPFFPTEIDAVLHRVFGLQSPKLSTNAFVREFGIKNSWPHHRGRARRNRTRVRVCLVPRSAISSLAAGPRKRSSDDSSRRVDGERQEGGNARAGKLQPGAGASASGLSGPSRLHSGPA